MNWNDLIPELPRLAAGAHQETEHKVCAMEMVAFMERLPHSDSPECTCPILAEYVRTLNDSMPDDRRNDLLPVLPRLVGTVNPGYQQKRGEYFATKVCTELVPISLRGIVDDELVDAMIGATTLKEMSEAADAAARAAAYAAYAAYAATADAAYAAAAYAAADAANAADAAARAAYAAAYAAYAATGHDFWQHAIDMLIGAIELDPSIEPAKWEETRAREVIELCGA